MSKPVYVTARFRSKPDKTEAMKSLLHKIISQTLAQEPGCIIYTYLQATDDETLFTSLEVWQDSVAETAHWQMDHLKASLEQLPALLDGQPEVKKWQRL